MPDLTQDLEQTSGGRYRCPWCGTRRGISFNPDKGDSGTFNCFGCEMSGDGVDLYVELRNADVADALDAFGIDRGDSDLKQRVKEKEQQAPRPETPDRTDAEWRERCHAYHAMNADELRMRDRYKTRRAKAWEERDRKEFDRWQARLDDLHEHALLREMHAHRRVDRADVWLPEQCDDK